MAYIEKTPNKKEFEPVKLVIETAEELAILWHRLNCGHKFDETYKLSKKIGSTEGSVKTSMWLLLNQEMRKQKVSSSANIKDLR